MKTTIDRVPGDLRCPVEQDGCRLVAAGCGNRAGSRYGQGHRNPAAGGGAGKASAPAWIDEDGPAWDGVLGHEGVAAYGGHGAKAPGAQLGSRHTDRSGGHPHRSHTAGSGGRRKRRHRGGYGAVPTTYGAGSG